MHLAVKFYLPMCEGLSKIPSYFTLNNDRGREALTFFGDIKEILHQQWLNIPGVHTGNRLVHMVHKHEIPLNLVIE